MFQKRNRISKVAEARLGEQDWVSSLHGDSRVLARREGGWRAPEGKSKGLESSCQRVASEFEFTLKVFMVT